MTIDNMTRAELADRVFTAVAAGDEAGVRAHYAEDARVWSNLGGNEAEMDVDAIVALVQTLAERIPDFHYAEARITETATGFVRQHLVSGTSPAGEAFAFPACCVGHVRDGRVTRIEEYLDSGHLTAMGL